MKNTILILVILNLFFSCSNSDSANDTPCENEAQLTTNSVSDITATTAVFNGNIIEPCDTNIIIKGFVFSTNPGADRYDYVISITESSENLSILINIPDYNGIFYVRTFLLTDNGEFYGNEVEFERLYEERTYVPDDNFEKMLIAWGYDDHDDSTLLDDYVVTSKIRTVKILSLGDEGIEDLTGIEDFMDLEELYLYDNQISTLDLSNNVKLIKLDCSDNQLTSLNINQNIDLWHLDVGGNQLTELDISNNINLYHLYCHQNNLSNLDLSSNINLRTVHCRFNQFSNLDVSAISNLLNFYWTSNPISCIQVSQNQYDTLLTGWYGSNWDGYTMDYFSLNCN
ncbi:leucine-rich repeat domain-containing protein [Winogradskyella sp. PC D3.3]